MNKGWIKLHRKIEDWCWFGDPNTFVLFIHLLILANTQDKNWRTIIIKRGSFVTSVAILAKRIGLSVQQTRTALDKLISTNEVTKSSTSIYTVISINNYDKYQEVTKSVTNEQQTSNKRVTTTKEYKNIRNKDNNIYISEKELNDIAEMYNVDNFSVKSLYEDMILYCERNGKKYKSYPAALKTWVRTSIKQNKIKVIPKVVVHEDIVSPEERLRNIVRIEEMKSKLAPRLHL